MGQQANKWNNSPIKSRWKIVWTQYLNNHWTMAQVLSTDLQTYFMCLETNHWRALNLHWSSCLLAFYIQVLAYQQLASDQFSFEIVAAYKILIDIHEHFLSPGCHMLAIYLLTFCDFSLEIVPEHRTKYKILINLPYRYFYKPSCWYNSFDFYESLSHSTAKCKILSAFSIRAAILLDASILPMLIGNTGRGWDAKFNVPEVLSPPLAS